MGCFSVSLLAPWTMPGRVTRAISDSETVHGAEKGFLRALPRGSAWRPLSCQWCCMERADSRPPGSGAFWAVRVRTCVLTPWFPVPCVPFKMGFSIIGKTGGLLRYSYQMCFRSGPLPPSRAEAPGALPDHGCSAHTTEAAAHQLPG